MGLRTRTATNPAWAKGASTVAEVPSTLALTLALTLTLTLTRCGAAAVAPPLR